MTYITTLTATGKMSHPWTSKTYLLHILILFLLSSALPFSSYLQYYTIPRFTYPFSPLATQRIIKMTMKKKIMKSRRFLCWTMKKQTKFFYTVNDNNSNALISNMFYLKIHATKNNVLKKQVSTLAVCNEMVDLGG